MAMNASPLYMERLLPILVHIQTSLEEDLSLAQMADRANVSPFHFHRLFRQTIGETLKQYTQRLRLERAAHELRIRQASILEVALGAGYQSHETFTRAFKRQFGVRPKDFREIGRLPTHAASSQPEPLNKYTTNYQLSKVRVQQLQAIPLAFIRNLGPYGEVDATLFDQLLAWAKEKQLYTGDNLLLGIGHDAPDVTPPDKLRFDACLAVPEPFQAEGKIGYQPLPAGHFAIVSYIGRYGATMEQAYPEIFQQVVQLEGYDLIGLPIIEIYRTTHINPDYDLNHTDICIPVVEKA
jgi:AraC family transcriptional regulator